MPCERKHIEAIEESARTFYQHASIDFDSGLLAAVMFATISAALAACDESPWRGMESAPRDGYILVVTNRSCGPEYAVAYWWSGDWRVWSDCNVCWPTHWMPLPEGPRKDEA